MNILEYLISTRKKSFSICMSFTTLKIQGMEYHSRDYFIIIFEPANKKQFLHLKAKINKKPFIFSKVRDHDSVFQYTLSKNEVQEFKDSLQCYRLIKDNEFGKIWEYAAFKPITEKIKQYEKRQIKLQAVADGNRDNDSHDAALLVDTN